MIDDDCREWTFELARINEEKQGRRHRYAYGFTGFVPPPDGESPMFGPGGALVKMDTEANGVGGPPPSTKPRLRTEAGLRGSEPESCPTNPSVKAWSSASEFPSEPVFVPRPDATAEDDGVLLFLGYDTLRRESFLGVLDAIEMVETARAYCGARCCVSFHGHWLPEE